MSIVINVLKVLVCRTPILGYGLYFCPECKRTIRTPHSCKSRFCSSCGKKATDNWIKNSFNTLPKTKWQHITFTLPDVVWEFFWVNRSLMNKVPPIAANIIKELAEKDHFLPGILLAIHIPPHRHRDLKRNFHIHLSTTAGGICLPDRLSYIEKAYFHHRPVKNMWKYRILNLLREEFKQGKLRMPPKLRHIKTYSVFNSWTSQLYTDRTQVFEN